MRFRTKANYGWDAPYTIRNLAIAGVLCLILGITGVHSTRGPFFPIQHVLGYLLLGGFTFSLLEALYMIWSSKIGKYIVRERLIDLLRLTGHEIVLDVGCGRGLVLNGVAKRLVSGKAVGIDIWNNRDQSGNHAEATLNNAIIEGVRDRVEVIDADARCMPFEDDVFDAVVSSLALHNIPGRQGRRQAIREIYRVLRPGGRFAILDIARLKEYEDELTRLGAAEVRIHGPHYLMFPPVRIITGVKR